MDNLPPEILREVFIQLELRHRLTCLTVCRSWWSILDGGSLFYQIWLDEYHQPRFNRMMDMFEQSPDLAVQVEELGINLYAVSRLNSRQLFNIFPNARIMTVIQHRGWSLSKTQSITEPVVITYSKPTIEFLSDFYPFNVVSQIFYSNLGGRLQELYLSYNVGFDFSFVVSLLKDLPVLKTLTIKEPIISIDNLEELHNSIPSLENLFLYLIIVKPGNMPLNIVPATGIKRLEFRLRSVTDIMNHIQIYHYATQKYTSIIDIEYDDNVLNESYAYDTKELYLNGLVDFYKFIGPCTSEFTIRCLPDSIDIFDVLDGVGSQVKKLKFRHCEGGTILHHLSQSDQSKHVEELDSWATAIGSIHLMKNMTNLTWLSIASSETRIDLADCLDACPPSLKTLKIACPKLVVEPFSNTLGSIEKLDIICSAPPSAIGDIISSCFPNLVELILEFDLDENISVSLKNPHFRKAVFYINMDYKSQEYGFCFKSPHYPENQNYFGNNVKEKTRVQYQDLEDLPTLSVVSLSETRLEIGDTNIQVLRC